MADDRIDSLIGQKAFDEIERLETGLNGLVETFIKSSNAAKLLEAALLKESSIKGVNDAINKQKTVLGDLEKQVKEMETAKARLAKAESEHGKALAATAIEIQKQNTANKNAAREAQAAEGSINQMSASLIKMRMQYDAMSKSLRDSPLGTELVKRIQSTDAALKALDGSTGRFQRNVGDYKNQLFGLTQTLREMPAFAYSATTGIMGISNNLPILADEFKKTAAATNESTGKVNGFGGALKIFGKSLFNFGNLFAIAIGLITIFSAQITMAATGAKKAKESVDDLTNSQDALNMALKSTEYKKAVENVNELRINIDLAKKGFLDKKEVVNEYNKTLGDTLGRVTSLDGAEQMLVKNGDAYIQMTLLKAAANLALEKAAGEALKAELKKQETQQALDENVNSEGKYSPGSLASLKLLFTQGLGSDADNLQKQTKKEVEGIEKEGNKFKNIAYTFQQQAATIAKSLGMDFFGGQYDTKPKKEKKVAGKPEINPNLSDTDLADLKAYYENLRKAQIEAMGKLVNDPESMKAFEDMLISESVLEKPISDEKAKELADSLAKWSKEKADKLKIQIQAEINKEKLMKDLQVMVDGIRATNEALSAVSDIIYDREIARIDERDKKLQASYDLEKAQIDSKFISQVQKDRELKQLDARREAERKALERERIASARRNAQRQKQLDVANIITTTALAVMGALSRAKTDGPTAYAQAIAVGITGAAQLARAIAAPLPQYAKGTDNHPGGLAEVGEQGVEMGILPSGQKFLTPATSTIMDLPAKTKIIPHKDLMASVYDLAYRKLGSGNIVTTDTMQEALLESFENMTKEMKGIKNEIRNQKLGVNLYGDMEHFITMKKIIS